MPGISGSLIGGTAPAATTLLYILIVAKTGAIYYATVALSVTVSASHEFVALSTFIGCLGVCLAQ
jgi:hypothetical protein